jgi:hypothetical protein
MAIMMVVVLLINILDHMVGITEWFHSIMIMTDLLYIVVWPMKILLAASCYVGTLYLDIHRTKPSKVSLFCSFFSTTPSNRNVGRNNSNNDELSKTNSTLDSFNDNRQLELELEQEQQYCDKKRNRKRKKRRIPCSIFLPKVGYAFCKVLPAYPFLAVGMSVGFLFLIHVWEFLHLPLVWLQMPIYYGTLYGPLAYTYVYVKRQVLFVEATVLPT